MTAHRRGPTIVAVGMLLPWFFASSAGAVELEARTASVSAESGADALGADTASVADVLEADALEGYDLPIEEVQVVEQRLAEAARPDTVTRLTAKDLEERGITNLAQALSLVSDTTVRASGRGGFQVDIRGARKGGVLILMDGVPISDVYNGNFDLTSIPTTDIMEIRVALTPASPLDGPGGNGGVIEVLTRSATGPERVRADLQASTAPGANIALGVRTQLAEGLFVRVSGGGQLANRALPVMMPDRSLASVEESSRSAFAGLRVERRFGNTRTNVDFAVTRRSFLIPPEDASIALVQRVDREDLLRATAGAESLIGRLTLSLRAYSLLLDRSAIRFRDATLSERLGSEALFAHRTGGRAQADWLLGDSVRLTLATHLVVEGAKSALSVGSGGADSHGVASVAEPAAGVIWAILPSLELNATAGLAVPLGLGANPWPEAKVWLTYTSTGALEVRLTGARKGRVPTLRDRFEIGVGNRALDPELGTSAELDVTMKPLAHLSFTASGYYRFTEGLIRRQSVRAVLDNVGNVSVAGVEGRADAKLGSLGSFGASYAFAHARSATLGKDPLDFFPGHRAQGWVVLQLPEEAGVSGIVRYMGTRVDSGTSLAPYTTVDVAAFGRVDVLRVTGRVENVLDQGYEARAGVPGFGRTLFLGVQGEL